MGEVYLALDPLAVGMTYHLGAHYFRARQYDLAVTQLQKALALSPNHTGAHAYLGLTYAQQARYSEAIAELQKSTTLGGADSRGAIGYVYAMAGQRAEAEKRLAELQAEAKQVSSYRIAGIYAGLGEKDQAFAWLEKAIAERDPNFTDQGPKMDVEFDNLRSDPRLAALLRRVGLTP
jgi:tetratricopeptide (TPR) repeat protein